jgi:hypothetical protein
MNERISMKSNVFFEEIVNRLTVRVDRHTPLGWGGGQTDWPVYLPSFPLYNISLTLSFDTYSFGFFEQELS